MIRVRLAACVVVVWQSGFPPRDKPTLMDSVDFISLAGKLAAAANAEEAGYRTAVSSDYNGGGFTSLYRFLRNSAFPHHVRPAPGVAPWTDNISHGELLRDGCDETMTVDRANLRFLFQGMLDTEKAAKSYRQFP